ncbi:hypothetical protein A6A19_08245 [Actinobacillus delphinicola]|uniref:oligosaccharide flippase family protein n=1 Tax=Actinobacillus delphinicola TaxID=51161 RepID=UPI0024431A38|nr:oligosaccharide flippase family protein [Actinobacillus delphinicola]MDG6897963.1 hypothetical protein [Actinobacillus delphinicola]
MLNKKIIHNIAWLLGEHSWRIISGLIVASILARQLSLDNYGIFQYSLALVAIFSSVSFICSGEVLVPMFANVEKNEQNKILINAFFLRLFFSILAFILLNVYAYFTETINNYYVVLIIGLSLLMTEATAVVVAWLQSKTYMKPNSVLFFITQLIKTLFCIILYFIGVRNVYIYAFVFVLQPILASIGLIYIYFKMNKSFIVEYDFLLIKKLFKLGLPFFYGLMVWYLFSKLDFLFLKQMVSVNDLAYYGAAVQLTNTIKIMAPIFVMSMAPILVYKQTSNYLVKRNILLMSGCLLILGILTAIFVQLFAPFIVPFLFGNKYDHSIKLTILLTWFLCLFFVESGLNVYLLKIQEGNLITIKWIIVSIVSIPTYFIFIKYYNIYGAVYTQIVVYLLAIVIGLWILINKNKITK